LFPLSRAAAAAPKRKVQTTLSNMVVRGADAIVQETRQKIGTYFPYSLFTLQIFSA